MFLPMDFDPEDPSRKQSFVRGPQVMQPGLVDGGRPKDVLGSAPDGSVFASDAVRTGGVANAIRAGLGQRLPPEPAPYSGGPAQPMTMDDSPVAPKQPPPAPMTFDASPVTGKYTPPAGVAQGGGAVPRRKPYDWLEAVSASDKAPLGRPVQRGYRGKRPRPMPRGGSGPYGGPPNGGGPSLY